MEGPLYSFIIWSWSDKNMFESCFWLAYTLKMFSSDTAWPNWLKFDMEHLWKNSNKLMKQKLTVKPEVQPMPAKFASSSPACRIPLFGSKFTLRENLLCKHNSLRDFFKSLVTGKLKRQKQMTQNQRSDTLSFKFPFSV